MKITAIFGSPRNSGFSSLLHEAFLSSAEERGCSVSRVYAYASRINPCTDCGLCRDESRCCHDDDMTRIYAMIRASEAISLSSPVYFSALPGPLKNLIDRCQLFWEENRRKGEIGSKKNAFFIAVSGSSYRQAFSPSVTIVRHFFNTLNCDFDEKGFFLLPGTDSIETLPYDMTSVMSEKGKIFLDNILSGSV